ncbi:SRPBCC family protein [Nocardia takedensis]
MGQVSASSSIAVAADPHRTLEAVADYQTVRPRILSSHYSEYKVIEGGKATDATPTVVEWRLQATESRVRNVRATVTADESSVTERDANSTLVTTWKVSPDGAGSQVTVTTTWQGAGGVKGIFEGIFAPLGLKKIQGEVLGNLKKELG